MAPTAAPAYKPVGFENATRHNLRDIGASLPYSANGTVTVDLPKMGLLSRLFVLVKGSFTNDITTLTKSSFGPYNLIKRIRLTANNGTDIINCSGFELYLINLVSCENYRNDQSGDDQTYKFDVTASQTDYIRFGFELPLTVNDRDLIGLFLLQNPQTVLTLAIDWDNINANSGPYTNGGTGARTAISINAYVVAEFFAVPQHIEDYPRLDYIYQTIAIKQAIVAVGEQIFNMPIGNLYTRIVTFHEHNAVLAPSSDVTKIEVRYNQTEVPYTMDSDVLRWILRDMYGRDVPQGVFALDFNHQGIPDLGTARDYVNSHYLTDFQWRPVVAAGATLGSGTNFLHVINQQLVKLA